MADDVKWIRFKVGTFDGMSFKRIKKAQIDGVVSLRDKLTAVWFELLDLGGKVNNQGFLINDELAFRSFQDIAIVLDRTEEEVEMCIKWFISERMMEITDDILMISNWNKYQNIDGLDKIRLQNRERQSRFKEKKKQLALEYKGNVTDNVMVTHGNGVSLIDNNTSSSSSISKSKEKDSKGKTFKKPTIEEVTEYCNERNKGVNPNKWYYFYESKGWMVGKNKMKDWKAAVITWEKDTEEVKDEYHVKTSRI